MSGELDPLLRDLLGFVGSDGRAYADVIEAWRTSCPRLPVWEEANERGLLARAREKGAEIVRVTEAGAAFMAQRGG